MRQVRGDIYPERSVRLTSEQATITRRDFLLLRRAAPVVAAATQPGDSTVQSVVEIVEELCVALTGFDCRACVDRCPLSTDALSLTALGPQVELQCDGCGECIRACDATHDMVALRLVPKTISDDHAHEGKNHV